jgi:uncharacterized protein (DUF486 family)
MSARNLKCPARIEFSPHGRKNVRTEWFSIPANWRKGVAGDFLAVEFDKTEPEIHFLGMDFTSSRWLPVVLLTCSNVFMTFAWYGHLKFKSKPLLVVILVSWGIAFFEYCFQVPANRWGSNVYSPFQLKIIQEIITLTVFVVFAFFYFHEKFRWNHFAAFVCIIAAVAFAFWPKS